jgi:radical SAM superfamily enzyme YgiQ (UPF0313 family)
MKPHRILFAFTPVYMNELSSVPLLSAIAKSKGHFVKVVEIDKDLTALKTAMAAFRPDIVAYSMCSVEATRYLEVNRALKREFTFHAVLGGAHPTFFPEVIEEDGVDSICVGEGDLAFRSFLNTFGTPDQTTAPNFIFKMADGSLVRNAQLPLLEDLDSQPFADRASLYEAKPFLRETPVKSFFAGRGCPYNCSYCFNHIYNRMYRGKGTIVRTKSISYLIREINEVKHTYPMSFVRFHDDIFGIDKEWLQEFAERFPREVGLPFICYARPNIITEQYCALLKQAGCHAIMTAVECGDEAIRNKTLRRHMSDKTLVNAFRIINESGIRIFSLNMVGLPGEGEAEIRKTIDLNRQLGTTYACVSIFQPHPGTDLANQCMKANLVRPEQLGHEGYYQGTSLNLPQELKDYIYVTHKFFALFVDYPQLEKLTPLFVRMKLLYGLYAAIYRVYYGYMVSKKIYPVRYGLIYKLRSLLFMMVSKNKV